MNRFLRLIFGIFLIFTISTGEASAAFFSPDTTTVSDQEKSLFGTLADIRSLESQLAGMEIDLKYSTENFINEAEKAITERITEKEQINNQLGQLELELQNHLANLSSDPSIPAEIKKEKDELYESMSNIDEEIATLEVEKETITKDHKDYLIQKSKDIETAKLEIAKNKEIAKQQFYDLLRRAVLFASFILVALLLGKITNRMIKKHGKALPQKRQEILLKITNIFVISVITITVFAVMFSQFATFLPFLALLGTGLAFAVRDVISSFIAWFFIGTKQGYKIGDLIEVDGVRGRVLDIHLIHTILQETGLRGPSGKIITVPNKRIFESEVKNFSKMFRFAWVMLDFLLEQNSNIEKTKRLLYEIIEESNKNDMEEIAKNLPSLSRKYGFNEDNIKPQMFFELEEKGVRVKAKFFCRLQHRHLLRSEISEKFLEKTRYDDEINLRFLPI